MARPQRSAPARPQPARIETASAPPLYASPLYAPPAAAPPLVPAMPGAEAVSFRERLLLIVIYIAVLASSVAFIEPSPHDALMGLLAVACLIAGVRFDRKVAVLFLLLLIWNGGGLLSLANVPERDKTIQYAATSIYLAIAAVMWACILADNTLQRMAALRSAYILTAVLAGLAGILGYFNVAGLAHFFTDNNRAMGAFKDPNVYGPFLIWPALVLMERMLVRRIGVIDLGALGILVVALLLSFSRGAWAHFAFSAAIVIMLSFLTARDVSTRMRIFVMSAVAVGLMVVFVAILLSIPAIHKMFEVRAHLIQSYDVGQGGRFRLQEIALGSLLKFPNGMGPFEFAARERPAAAQRLSAGLPGLWLGRRRELHPADADDVLGRLPHRVRGDALAELRHHRARRVHRRSGGKLHHRQRPLAALLPAARHGLGPVGGDLPLSSAGAPPWRLPAGLPRPARTRGAQPLRLCDSDIPDKCCAAKGASL